MALDLRVAVHKAVVDLRREISKKTSDLASLKSKLARYQKVQGILYSQPGVRRPKANGKVRRKWVDWNTVLKQLPGSFRFRDVVSLAKLKSRNTPIASWQSGLSSAKSKDCSPASIKNCRRKIFAGDASASIMQMELTLGL